MNEQKDQKAIIYTRTASSLQKRTEKTLDSQQKLCFEYAKKQGYNIKEYFCDIGVSGELDNPGVEAMLDFLNAQTEEYVVITQNIDRIARYTPTCDIIDIFEKAGAKIESLASSKSATPEDRFMEYLSIAILDMELQVAETKEGT